MRISYTGKVELRPPHQKKVEAKIGKLGKLLDHKHEREAHVVVAQQRHLYKAEVTVNYHDHPLVGVGSNTDPMTAILEAVDRLEKQAIKVRAKWRDTKRTPRKATVGAVAAERALEEELVEKKPAKKVAKPEPRVKRVANRVDRKPMTMDEALLEMEGDLDYLVYRDSETDRVSVMIRRADGDFDLIEA